MSEFRLSRCSDDAAWSRFLAASPQACVYCEPATITALGCEADYWLLERNGVAAAAIPVITDNAAGSGLPIHSYYVGPMLHRECWDSKPNRRTENLLAISEACMHELTQHYDHLQFCLHPDLTDIRGFDWFNYHTPEQGRVRIAPRYTAECDLAPDHLRHDARGARRREEKYAAGREHQQFAGDGDADELVSLWVASLVRQQVVIPDTERDITRRFAETLCRAGRARIYVTRDASGDATSAGMLLFDYHGRAHLPVVGTGSTRYGGTLLYFGIMEAAAASGCTLLDLNGANSPSRGYFKHSIGGTARLYFQLDWRRP
jgi:hypothetical protein